MFDSKGHFIPLSDAQRGRLNDEQRIAYDKLASDVSELELANLEAQNAIAESRAAITTLHDAEAIEAKKPQSTFLAELRRTQAQWRADHR
jgi:hypothetical protein